MNLQIAQIHLQRSDQVLSQRNWQDMKEEIISLKAGSMQERWSRAVTDKAFDTIRHVKLLQTNSAHFRTLLNAGSAATNRFFCRSHNFAIGMH